MPRLRVSASKTTTKPSASGSQAWCNSAASVVAEVPINTGSTSSRILYPCAAARFWSSWKIHREAFPLQLLVLLEDGGYEVFFGDEAGFEGDSRPRQKWVKRGARPTRVYQGSHVRRNVSGAVNPPQSDQLVTLIVRRCDTDSPNRATSSATSLRTRSGT